MKGNNPRLYLVNVTAHTNLVKSNQLFLKILSGNEILNKNLTSVKDHNSVKNVWKWCVMCVNIYAYTNFGKILSFVLKILSGNEIMTEGRMEWRTT